MPALLTNSIKEYIAGKKELALKSGNLAKCEKVRGKKKGFFSRALGITANVSLNTSGAGSKLGRWQVL